MVYGRRGGAQRKAWRVASSSRNRLRCPTCLVTKPACITDYSVCAHYGDVVSVGAAAAACRCRFWCGSVAKVIVGCSKKTEVGTNLGFLHESSSVPKCIWQEAQEAGLLPSHLPFASL